MANVERRIEGFGYFSYDQAVYDELMRLSKAELVERELEDTIYQRTAVRGLKKADLAVLVAHRETARREWDANRDQSVNEAIDGAEVATRWLALPEQQRTKSVVQTAIDYAGVPSPMREYQSSQEALGVLEAHLDETNRDDQPSGDDHLSAQDHRDGCECESCDGFYADDQDFALGDVPELEYDDVDDQAPQRVNVTTAEVEATSDADADAELLSFMRAVVELPNPVMPVTETDVRALDGSALATLVQSGTKLIWGKLIAVVNRRSSYIQGPLLATVEFPDGVRRLVSADDILVSDTFVAA
jgi:hypothetical protein